MNNAFSLNVLDYRGVSNTASSNSAEGIQQAIDEAHQKGGGTVYFPPGRYLTGSLELKSNVSFYLEAGAVILGSGDILDYKETAGRRYLISGFDCENISICGGGKIHGQGINFWDNSAFYSEGPSYGKYKVFSPKDPRPFALLHFRNSRNILITGISMVDSPCYTVWLLGCDEARISGIRIMNSHHGPNTDGLDIDCSSNISISDCSIDAGDDCIALKSDINALGRVKACENINVNNCQLSSTANGIRIGFEGDGPIRNCIFSNIVMHDCNSGISINVIAHVERKKLIKIEGGARIENIVFSDLVMDVNRAFYLWIGNQDPGRIEGYIKDVKFQNIIAKVTRGNYIGGCAEVPIRSVEFLNLKIRVSGEKKNEFIGGVPYPLSVWGVWGTSGLPHVFYCRYVEDLSLKDINIEYAEKTENWLSSIRCEDVLGGRIIALASGRCSAGSEYPVIHLSNIEDVLVTGCSLSSGGRVFLLLDGGKTVSAALCFNDLRKAEKAVECRDDIRPGALIQYANLAADLPENNIGSSAK